MKKISFVICGFAAVGLLVSVLAAGEKQSVPTGSKTEVGQLTQQIDSLQARIKTLEERLAKLEKDRTFKVVTLPSSVAQPSPNSIQIPGAVADPNRPPNAWGEREFNGMKYYLIPLGAEGN